MEAAVVEVVRMVTRDLAFVIAGLGIGSALGPRWLRWAAMRVVRG